MKRIVVVILALSACRSSGVQTAAPPADATAAPPVDAAVVTAADAAPAPEAGRADAAASEEARRGRALPPAERLLAPFHASRRRGFVAMTNGDRSAPLEVRRTSASLDPAAAVDLAKPVLVASFTKLWTAVAALRMIERGELSLDDTVKSALPALAARPWAVSTIRELLTHTSLVPELDEKGGYYRRTDIDFAYPAVVLARHIPADWTEKRGVYKYRNSELALVGAILAARANLPAEQVLAREVFERAGMEHAGLLGARAVPGLDLTPMGPIRPQNFFTAGAGYASPSDLLAFFEALAGPELLGAASKAQLFEGDARRGYGALGCWAYPFARPDGGTTILVERPGSFGNVRLFSAFFPDEKRAVIAWSGDGLDMARPRAEKGIGNALARAALE